jgi:TonB family protein
MSYASSPKSFPNFLKSLPQKLSQPTAIAVIASVGIHAVLGLSLPYFPISSKEKPKPVRNVQLLDLKPEELNRLPPPPLPLEPLPSSINQQIKPLSPLSPSGSSSGLGARSQPSTKDQNLSLSTIPLDIQSSVGGFSGKSKRLTNFDKMGSRNSSLQQDLDLQRKLERTLRGQQTGKQSSSLKAGNFQSSTRNSAKNFSGVSSNLRDRFGLPGGLTPANDQPPLPGTSYSDQTSGLSGYSAPLPLISSNSGTSGSQSPNRLGTSRSTQSPDQTTQAAAPTVGQTNLTDNKATRNFNAFVQNGEDWKKRHQVSGEPEELPITVGKYPQKARAAGVDRGSVQVNWKVDKNGNIISDSLEVIGSSEGGVFDQEALSAVRKLPIPVTGQEKAYTVRVIFFDDSKAPASATGSSTTPSEGKNPTEQQNLPQQLTPAKPLAPSQRITPPMQLTPPERQNSSQPSTPIQRFTLPERQNAPEWSKPAERKIPSLPENSSQPPTPTEGKNPTERPNSSQPPTPTEGKNPTEHPNSSQLSTPTEGKNPTERPNSSQRSIPIEQLAPPKRDNSSERVTPTVRITPPKGDNSSERATPTERITPPKRDNASERATPTERPNSTERQNSAERKTPVERQNSPEPRSSSDSQNSKKPQKLPEPQSSEKPQRLPSPPNSIKP